MQHLMHCFALYSFLQAIQNDHTSIYRDSEVRRSCVFAFPPLATTVLMPRPCLVSLSALVECCYSVFTLLQKSAV